MGKEKAGIYPAKAKSTHSNNTAEKLISQGWRTVKALKRQASHAAIQVRQALCILFGG